MPTLTNAQSQEHMPASQEPRRPSHSWPATWPDSSRTSSTWVDTNGTTQSLKTQGPANSHIEDHQTSGDSIPVGCEASHLDISQDSGMASLIREPLVQQASLPVIPVVSQEHIRQPSVQENFCPGPESTFIPVEPAKDPTVSNQIYFFMHIERKVSSENQHL